MFIPGITFSQFQHSVVTLGVFKNITTSGSSQKERCKWKDAVA
jgi:hypothetical protein